MKFFKILIVGLFLIIFSSCLCAQASDSLLMKIDEDTYKIDVIKIDIADKEITFPAEFNMNKGVIETILVGPQGRLHETILKTDALPSYIQTSLLLLGLECGQNMELGNYDIMPKGDSLLIYASWTDTLGITHDEPIERLVWNIPQKREMLKTYWIFLGSKIVNGQFIADLDQNIIRTYHDPFAIIHSSLPTISDDTFYEANKNIVPEKGTKATIKIKALN
jgi:hypothetical protein